MLEIIAIHGWTDTSSNLKRCIDSFLPDVKVHYISAPFQNMWFEYDERKYSILGRHELLYKDNAQIYHSVQMLHNLMHRIVERDNDIVILATSQGATIGFHSIVTFPNPSSVRGAWLHNTAGIYSELIPLHTLANFNIRFQRSLGGGTHALDMNDSSVIASWNTVWNSLNRQRRPARPVLNFFHVANDNVIPTSIVTYMQKILDVV
jgi:hypothetical protein